jgi:hypothetical protein
MHMLDPRMLHLLGQFTVFRITLTNGHILVSRYLSNIVSVLNRRGIPTNRTAVHNALKGAPGIKTYKNMSIERTTLTEIGPLNDAEVV